MDRLPKDIVNLVSTYLKHNLSWKEVIKGNGIHFKLYLKSSDTRDKLRFTVTLYTKDKQEFILEHLKKFINNKTNVVRFADCIYIRFVRREGAIALICNDSMKMEKRFSKELSEDIILWLEHVYRVIKRYKVGELIRPKTIKSSRTSLPQYKPYKGPKYSDEYSSD